MLISSVIDNIICSNFNCIWVLFSQLGLDLKLSCNRNAEWIVDPPIRNAADPVGAVMRAIGWSSSGFTVCFEKVRHVSLYKTYNMTFPCLPWATKKNSVCFLLFSMSECIYVALAPCSVVHYYMVLIFVQGVYMFAIVLKIHVLPFSSFYIQHQQWISFVSGVVITHCIYCIFFFLLFILQCGETLDMCCSVILHYIWSNHLPWRLWYIVFQILQVQVKCHTIFIESFYILMYYILHTDVWLIISCKWWYDVILIIPWIIQKQLWMVIFFWFCMNFVLSYS